MWALTDCWRLALARAAARVALRCARAKTGIILKMPQRALTARLLASGVRGPRRRLKIDVYTCSAGVGAREKDKNSKRAGESQRQ